MKKPKSPPQRSPSTTRSSASRSTRATSHTSTGVVETLRAEGHRRRRARLYCGSPCVASTCSTLAQARARAGRPQKRPSPDNWADLLNHPDAGVVASAKGDAAQRANLPDRTLAPRLRPTVPQAFRSQVASAALTRDLRHRGRRACVRVCGWRTRRAHCLIALPLRVADLGCSLPAPSSRPGAGPVTGVSRRATQPLCEGHQAAAQKLADVVLRGIPVQQPALTVALDFGPLFGRTMTAAAILAALLSLYLAAPRGVPRRPTPGHRRRARRSPPRAPDVPLGLLAAVGWHEVPTSGAPAPRAVLGLAARRIALPHRRLPTDAARATSPTPCGPAARRSAPSPDSAVARAAPVATGAYVARVAALAARLSR